METHIKRACKRPALVSGLTWLAVLLSISATGLLVASSRWGLELWRDDNKNKPTAPTGSNLAGGGLTRSPRFEGPIPDPRPDRDPERTRAILDALETRRTLSFPDGSATISDLITLVRDATREDGPDGAFPEGIPVYADPLGLAEQFDVPQPMPGGLPDVRLGVALGLALRSWGLTYAVFDGVLVITRTEALAPGSNAGYPEIFPPTMAPGESIDAGNDMHNDMNDHGDALEPLDLDGPGREPGEVEPLLELESDNP